MKRIVFFVLIFLGMMSNAESQTFRGGLNGGMVASQVSGDNSSGYNKFGLFFGPWVNFGINEKLRLQMEISYMQKGSRQTPNKNNNYYSYLSRLNYIEVPFMVRYQWSEKIEPEIGIAYGILLSSYEELYDTPIPVRPFYTHNSSLIVGVYYNLDERWSVNLRTSNSITPIRKHKSGQTYRLNFGQTNNILTLGLFYRV